MVKVVRDRPIPGLTSLVGRDEALQDVQQRLENGIRLITLVGTAGVGKTRLASELYHQVVTSTSYNAVAFVSLSHILDGARSVGADPDDERAHEALLHRICQQIASALKLDNHLPEKPSFETLITVLTAGVENRKVLLLLDNCEPDVNAVGDVVEALLTRTSTLQIVATSRMFLEISGEHLVQVHPLQIPDRNATRAEIDAAPAMELFLDRAKAAGMREDVLTQPTQWAAAVELVRRSEGLPLFLELMAANLRVTVPEQVLARLDDGLDLSQGTRGVAKNHVQLGKAVASSWDLCDQDQRRLWARLTVFSGAFTLDAAEDVCSGGSLGRKGIAALLHELVSRSIVAPATTDGRYSQHATLRAYGQRKLRVFDSADGDEVIQLRNRHRDWVAAFTARAAREWFGPDEALWLDRVYQELPHIFSAVMWCKETGQIDAGLTIGTDVCRVRVPFFYALETEIGSWLDLLLEQQHEEDGEGAKLSEARVVALAILCFMRLVLGDKVRGKEHLAEIDRLAQKMPRVADSPPVQFVRGTYLVLSECDLKGLDLLTQAAAGFQAAGLEGDAQMAKLLLALAAGILGPTAIADTASADCVDHAERFQAPWAITWAHWTTGLPARSHMRDVLRRCLTDQIALGDGWGTTWDVEAEAWRRVLEGKTEYDFYVAAVLLGGAISLQNRHGVLINGLGPFNMQRKKSEDLIIAKLGLVRFREAFNEGASLTTEQVYDLALSEDRSIECLDPFQRQIAGLVAAGMTNPAIAQKLKRTSSTIEGHLTAIYKILGMNRKQLAFWYRTAVQPDLPHTG